MKLDLATGPGAGQLAGRTGRSVMNLQIGKFEAQKQTVYKIL